MFLFFSMAFEKIRRDVCIGGEREARLEGMEEVEEVIKREK